MENGPVDFFAVRGAKKLLKSLTTTTLAQLWIVGLAATHDVSEAPTRRSDLVAGLRRVIQHAGHRHLTHLPPLALLRGIVVTLGVPLHSPTPPKIECQKRLLEYLDDNGLDYLLARLDDEQLTSICNAMGMVLAVGEGAPLDRQQRTFGILAAINSAGLHAFLESLAPSLLEQIAKDVGVALTDGEKKRKKGLLINDILTSAPSPASATSSSSSTTSAGSTPATKKRKKDSKNKAKGKGKKQKKAAEEEEEDEESEESELDLDDLERYSVKTLKWYCIDEGIKVTTKTKAAYIDAIIQYNKEADEKENPESNSNSNSAASSKPEVPESAASSNTSTGAAAATKPKPRRFKMLTLVKSETAAPGAQRQEEPVPKQAVALSPNKQKKRLREEEPETANPEPIPAEKTPEVVPSGQNEVSRLLSRIGLTKYIPLFAKEEVDMDALVLLEASHLVELGLPLGARTKLLKEIGLLKDKGTLPVLVPSADKGKELEQEQEQEKEKEQEQEQEQERNPNRAQPTNKRGKRRRSTLDELISEKDKYVRREQFRRRNRSFVPTATPQLLDPVAANGGGEGGDQAGLEVAQPEPKRQKAAPIQAVDDEEAVVKAEVVVLD